MEINNKFIKLLKMFVIGSFVLFAVTGVSIVYFTVSKAFDSKRIVDAQIEYQKALTENVGKPQIIEQRYFSPNK